jgi:hypothetical protein
MDWQGRWPCRFQEWQRIDLLVLADPGPVGGHRAKPARGCSIWAVAQVNDPGACPAARDAKFWGSICPDLWWPAAGAGAGRAGTDRPALAQADAVEAEPDFVPDLLVSRHGVFASSMIRAAFSIWP